MGAPFRIACLRDQNLSPHRSCHWPQPNLFGTGGCDVLTMLRRTGQHFLLTPHASLHSYAYWMDHENRETAAPSQCGRDTAKDKSRSTRAASSDGDQLVSLAARKVCQRALTAGPATSAVPGARPSIGSRSAAMRSSSSSAACVVVGGAAEIAS